MKKDKGKMLLVPTKNLLEAIMDEIKRVRELRQEYLRMPKGAGQISAMCMEHAIDKAEQSIKDDDVIQMLLNYENLKTYTG